MKKKRKPAAEENPGESQPADETEKPGQSSTSVPPLQEVNRSFDEAVASGLLDLDGAREVIDHQLATNRFRDNPEWYRQAMKVFKCVSKMSSIFRHRFRPGAPVSEGDRQRFCALWEDFNAEGYALAAVERGLQLRAAIGQEAPVSKEPAAATGQGAEHPERVEAVILGKLSDPLIVLGKKKPPLTVPQFNVVKALLDAGDAGLSLSDLIRKSTHAGAWKILKGLTNDPDWKQVIKFPGKPGKRYRISGPSVDPV